MIGKLIGWSARNVVLVVVAALFAVAGGLYALRHLPLDAIPDLSDTQVIVYTDYPGQAPQVVEDQVTYPLTTAMLTVPKSKVVRGFSFFGVSFVYVIFEDGTDIYWARSRVLEYLAAAGKRLPAGVTPTLGPDATGVGWAYQYAITSDSRNLAETRSMQDWNLKFGLAKAEGVSEVASVGGFVKQYNIVVDPQRMRDLGISLDSIREVVRGSNTDVGGRTVELSGFEFIVRGRGYLRGVQDLGKIVVKSDKGTPVLLKDVARIELGPDERRGLADLDGKGEVAGAITLQRFGSNALDVIDNVKARLAELVGSLPEGHEDRAGLRPVAADPVGDRDAEAHALRGERDRRDRVHRVPAARAQRARRHPDAAGRHPDGLRRHADDRARRQHHEPGRHRHRHRRDDRRRRRDDRERPQAPRARRAGTSRREILVEAAKEVGPALFFSLLVITVSFLPIFTLESQEGRLFGPLAFTKTFSMAAAAILSITLVPVLMVFFIRGRIVAEHRNPVNRALIWVYRPIIRLRAAPQACDADPRRRDPGGERRARRGGSAPSSCPSLNEGTLLYMPTTLPGISVTKAGELLQTQDRIIKSFPEVASVYGKAGRAETATDPAPTEMFETIVNLKPKEEWPAGHDHREPAGRDGQGAAVPGRLERLDHADQGAHRHARHRHPHAGRHQGAGPGPRARWRRRRAASRRSCARCRARRAPTPSACWAATTSRSCPTATRSPGTV